MDRRRFIFGVIAGVPLVRAAGTPGLRGKLKTGAAPTIEAEPGKAVLLSGDDATKGVLGDPRLDGSDFEVLGHFIDPTHFDVDKIHTKSLFVIKGGKRLMVTYWCDVCYIRTYTPGKCWCCQKDTDLDLRDPLAGE